MSKKHVTTAASIRRHDELTKRHIYKIRFTLDPAAPPESSTGKTRHTTYFSHLNALDFWPFMEAKIKAAGPGYPNAKIMMIAEDVQL